MKPLNFCDKCHHSACFPWNSARSYFEYCVLSVRLPVKQRQRSSLNESDAAAYLDFLGLSLYNHLPNYSMSVFYLMKILATILLKMS